MGITKTIVRKDFSAGEEIANAVTHGLWIVAGSILIFFCIYLFV